MAQREERLQSQEKKTTVDRRLDEIDAVLAKARGGVAEYDDALVRQLISHITAVDKQTITVCFKDGTEVTQEV
jgi:hypothetical protein